MGSSESKSSVVIRDNVDETKISTPDQLQYTFFEAPQEGCCFFGIKAAHDAYIALSSNQIDPEYEILIGTSYNTRTIIKKKKTAVIKTFVPNILHKDEVRYFWLKWKNNKLLLGRKDEQQAFANFIDYENIPINYFGICTYGSTGTWIIKKKYEIESQAEPSNARNEPSTSGTANNTGYSSKYSYSSVDFPHTENKTKIYEDLTRKKLNTDVENTSKINNNITNTLNNNKTNPVNYVDNFKNLNIKNSCDERQGSTSNDTLERLEKFFLESTMNMKQNQTSKDKSRKHHHRDRKNNSNMNRKPHSSSNKSDFKNKTECDSIISFDKLLEISRMSPQLILVELQAYKFERLFEIKLKKSYINIILNILSKLCQADFLVTKRSVITGFFSKEVFRKQLLDYMLHMRLQSDADYNKHSRHHNEMWESLYIVCKTAATIPAELQAGYLENLVFECQNTLEALLPRDGSRKHVLEKFRKLKEFVYFETRRRPLM
ncbi:protein NRDE2 homolog [Agrilus planipennis]|uniref:Protein NRDE2 homolog n=1 Tax=Agrilus planipennis TaxID=224129 RepID=A0A1W4WGH0_AGRPL|nr:protein NRDE2 homolog [Agrilus planipennis]